MSYTCPVCGSDTVESDKKMHQLPIVYGYPAKYDETIYTCTTCGESGDFSGVNDEKIKKAIELAKKNSVVLIIESLAHENIKMSFIERALELPTRTLARWKSGDIRIIRTYPWILEVADEHFEKSIANSVLVRESAQALRIALKSPTVQNVVHCTYHNDNESIKFTFEYLKEPNFSPPPNFMNVDDSKIQYIGAENK
jgi:hypothetical protein